MKYRLNSLLLLLMGASCTAFPSLLGGSERKPAQVTPAATGNAVTDTVNSVTALLHEYRWWALLGLILFPQVRNSLREMLKAMFLVPTLLFQKLAERLKKKDAA